MLVVLFDLPSKASNPIFIRQSLLNHSINHSINQANQPSKMDSYGFLWIPMDSYSTPKIWLGPHSNVHGGPWTTVIFELLPCSETYICRHEIKGIILSLDSHTASEPRMPITSSLCILWSIVLPDLQCSLNFLAMASRAVLHMNEWVRAAWCQSRWATRFMRSSGLGHWWQVYLWQNTVLYVSRHQPLEFDFAVRSHAQELSLYVGLLRQCLALGNAHPWWMK